MGLDDVIIAGRCLGAEHEALASARVTAQCFEYGHAAARAVTLSLEADVALRDIDVTELRRAMRLAGSDL
jgi:hypothetical protein